MKLLCDEMYPRALADHLRADGIDALTAGEAGLAGRPDQDLLEAAAADGRVVLTENVADFVRLAGAWVSAGRHHPGVLIALSSRFSRRPAGIARSPQLSGRLWPKPCKTASSTLISRFGMAFAAPGPPAEQQMTWCRPGASLVPSRRQASVTRWYTLG